MIWSRLGRAVSRSSLTLSLLTPYMLCHVVSMRSMMDDVGFQAPLGRANGV
jgi:hypothetical protein